MAHDTHLMSCTEHASALMELARHEEPCSSEEEEALLHCAECADCQQTLERLHAEQHAHPTPPSSLPWRARLSLTPDHPVWLRRLDRALSIAASYTMRPQLIMATLLIFMVGTSLLLLRARPAGLSSVHVVERGHPNGETPDHRPPSQEHASLDMLQTSASAHGMEAIPHADASSSQGPHVALAPLGSDSSSSGSLAPTQPASITSSSPASTGSPTASLAASSPPPTPETASADDAFASAMDAFKGHRYADAMRGFEIVTRGGGPQAPLAALYAARATRNLSGCTIALPRFNAIATRYVGSSVSAEGMWEAATCYRELGQEDQARQFFLALRHVAGFSDRAERELAHLKGGADLTHGSSLP